MNKPIETGVVNLNNLKDYKIYVDLDKTFKTKIIFTAKNIAGSWTNLTKELKTTNSIIFHFLNSHKILINTIIYLSNYLTTRGFRKFSLKDVEQHITRMGGKHSGCSKGAGEIIRP